MTDQNPQDPSKKKTVPVNPDQLDQLMSGAGFHRQGQPSTGPNMAAPAPDPTKIPGGPAPHPDPTQIPGGAAPPPQPEVFHEAPKAPDTPSPLSLSQNEIFALSQKMNIPCPHCGKTPQQPQIELTDDDRREWLRSLLGDRPFQKIYQLGVGNEVIFTASFIMLDAPLTRRKEHIENLISRQEQEVFGSNKPSPEGRALLLAKSLFQSLVHCERLGNKEIGSERVLAFIENAAQEQSGMNELVKFNLYQIINRLLDELALSEVVITQMVRFNTHFHSLVTELLNDAVNGNFTVGAGPA